MCIIGTFQSVCEGLWDKCLKLGGARHDPIIH